MTRWVIDRAVDPASQHARKADTEKLERLLADGFEPFGVVAPTAVQVASPVWVYLRKQQTPDNEGGGTTT